MIERFKGKEGRLRLVDAIANQELVLQNRALAQRLAEAAKLNEYERDQELYVQGDPGKNSLYFVVCGAMDLLVNGRLAASIGAGQAVGEFPILDPALGYTVTIRAKETSVVARVSEGHFRSIADECGEVWKNMAKMLMKRLHGTHHLIPPAKVPCVFIGHGRNSLWARVQVFLEKDLHLNTITYESEARVGMSIVPILEGMLQQATFAILVLTAEDETAEGGKRARQNVVHEAGLFQGMLGFRRAILLVENGIEGFSNVAGLQCIKFEGNKIDSAFYELQRVLKREEQIR
jgi:predicted nucleotide-binding protein